MEGLLSTGRTPSSFFGDFLEIFCIKEGDTILCCRGSIFFILPGSKKPQKNVPKKSSRALSRRTYNKAFVAGHTV